MRVTVTPAPDAEPPPGNGQNTGVSGATHAVVRDSDADSGASGPATVGKRAGRKLRPIRYAHTANDQATAPTTPAAAADSPTAPLLTPPAGTPPPTTAPASGIAPPAGEPPTVEPPAVPATGTPRGDTVVSGTVLPGPATADDEPGDYSGATGLVYETPTYYEAAPAAYDEPPEAPEAPVRNEGLGIFGDVATTEVPGDSVPAGELESRPPPAPGAASASAVGAAWNEPIAPPPGASGEAEDRKPNPFGRIRGIRPGGGQPPEDGQPRVNVRDLPPDVQLRFIRDRVIIALVIGVVSFILWRSWAISVTLVIIAWVLDTARRQRTALLYVNGGAHPGARKATSKQLRKMRREGYFTLDARPIPDSREVIDHLVVGPTGVYAIDSEKWDPKVPIRTWNNKKLYHGPASQKDRLEHAVWEASQAGEVLSSTLGTEIKVRPALAIYGPKIPWNVATIRNVDVFTGPALRKYLKGRGRMKDGVARLTREEARTIYDTAARMLPDVAQAYTPVG
ncbi:MAG: nuclease-related domain-containing protein [Trebonia sp.]